MNTVKISLFQAFLSLGVVRSEKKREKIKNQGGGEVREGTALPSSLYFSSLFLLRTAPHYLNAWNRLGVLKTGRKSLTGGVAYESCDFIYINEYSNTKILAFCYRHYYSRTSANCHLSSTTPLLCPLGQSIH